MVAVQGLYEVVREQGRTVQRQATQIQARDHGIEVIEAQARRIDDLVTRLAELTRLVRRTAAVE